MTTASRQGAATASKTHDTAELRADLLRLRKSVGFTDKRLSSSRALMAALGGAHEPLHVLRERFESAIDSLHDQDVTLLRGVYALTPDTKDHGLLKERRTVLGAQLGITEAGVADRDAAAVERLLAQLRSGWYPKSPVPGPLAGAHSAIVYDTAHITTLVRDGKHVESRHDYTLYCAYDGVTHIEWNIASPGRILVTGDFQLKTYEIPGGYSHQFWHRTPMQRGRRYELRFIVLPPKDDELWLWEESLAFHTAARSARFETLFLGRRPGLVWKFSGLTHLERPGTPAPEQVLEFGGGSSVNADFTDLHGGLFAGIAWDWDK